MKKLVFLDADTLMQEDLKLDIFDDTVEVEVFKDSTKSKEETIKRIGDASLVITNKLVLDKEVFDSCPKLEYVGVAATGFNIVDVEEAKKRGIVVTNIPTYGTDSVAQATIALLLELTNRVGHHSHEVKNGRWKNEEWCFMDYSLMELSGKTFGVIGFGLIGQKVSEIAKALGMKVYFYHPTREIETDLGEQKTLDELLEHSDVLSLHVPLTEETENLINDETIRKMKDGAILLNTARGALVDEDALFRALESRKLHSAGLDVTRDEPIKDDNLLLTLDNCVITPHNAWGTKEARERLLGILYDNVKSFLNGEVVNSVY